MLNKLKPTIAIIDSGIGGVSVLRQLISTYHSGNYIYYADNLYMPYGKQKECFLRERLDQIINMLNSKYCVDLIIIACNTASSVLQNNSYKNVITMTFNKDDIYLATPLTKKCLKHCNVIADSTLAKQIENNILNDKQIDNIVKKHVEKYKLNTLKSFTLACTHYELVADLFKKYCPQTNVSINSDKLIDKIKFNSDCSELTIYIMLSKPNESYKNTLLKLIGR